MSSGGTSVASASVASVVHSESMEGDNLIDEHTLTARDVVTLVVVVLVVLDVFRGSSGGLSIVWSIRKGTVSPQVQT